jgi:CheY-specific phosphatase CheX
MSPEQMVARIDGLVVSAARTLFEAHGLTVEESTAKEGETRVEHDIAASIGFTAPQAQGAVLMTTRKDVVTRAWPRELRHREPSERDACDWAGELVNQLLGRVKNALIPFGLTLEQSTPTVVTGRHVHRAPASTNVACCHLFLVVGGGSILVYFDAIISLSLVWSESADTSARSAEGDVHLF